ncbi:hypothetical protein M513_05807 [Trichuris suis]|uniref:Uncharacterized protein n=1 Tax=Trichuris suis TaxID=68888 RepID=A0A085M7Y0_9BILA|nr:hypothetical protein M513_05807 [Trichuris suis]
MIAKNGELLNPKVNLLKRKIPGGMSVFMFRHKYRVTSRSSSCNPICMNIFEMSACNPKRYRRKRNRIPIRSVCNAGPGSRILHHLRVQRSHIPYLVSLTNTAAYYPAEQGSQGNWFPCVPVTHLLANKIIIIVKTNQDIYLGAFSRKPISELQSMQMFPSSLK